MSRELLHDIFEESVLSYADSIAVKEENAAVTYMQLHNNVEQFLQTLYNAGLCKGDIVAVLMPPGIQWVTAMLGLFKAGIIYLPLSSTFPLKKLQDIYAQTSFKCVLVTPGLLPLVNSLAAQHPDQAFTVLMWQENGLLRPLHPVKTDQALSLREPAGLNDSSYIIYTSGSTGAGKAIEGSQRGIAHFINWQVKEFKLQAGIHVGQLASMVFDASFRDVFLPLSIGGTLYIPDHATRNNMALMLQWLSYNEISLIHSVPGIFKLLTRQLENGRITLNRLQYIFLAGEPLYARDVMSWRAAAGLHAQIINLYGTSETTMAKTFYRVDELPEDPAKVLPAGKPIDDTVVAIINGNRICRMGEIGEIYIKTPYWTKGYYNDEALTGKVFVQNPLVTGRTDLVYKTGDLGRYLADRTIEVIGRMDDQVKINGIRVELGEIEQAVLRMPGIQEAIVITRQDAAGNNEAICYYTNPGITGEDIRQFLQKELSDHLVPSYYVSLAEFPLTINGKVDKKALPEPGSINENELPYEAPQNSMEEMIERIWQEVIGRPKVGRNESFFMIGGNSLKAIQVVSRISKEYHVQVKVAEIFNNQSIATFSKIVAQAMKKEYEAIPLSPVQEHYELSHAQKQLWTLHRFDPDSCAYSVPSAFLLEGILNITALQSALEALVSRHEILRTSFITVDGKPRQQIHAAADLKFKMQLTDLRNDKDAYTQLDLLLQQAAALPFNLLAAPLLRVNLYLLSADRQVLFVNMHHIITDEWSGEILFRELLQLYQGFSQGQEAVLPPLRLQYKDFAAWYNRKLLLPSHQEHRDYWLTLLDGNIEALLLPVDFPRTDVRTAAGGVVKLALDKTTSAKLKELALENNTGFFTLLLSAINVLVYQLTGQQKIIIGTPWTCRTIQELETQIGLYVNTLPVYQELAPAQPFSALQQNMKDAVQAAAAHQDYPFDVLVEALKLKRRPDRSPVFDIGFTWHDEVHATPQDVEIVSTPYAIGFSGIKSDLWFHGTEWEGQLHLSLEYSGDLFRQNSAELFLHLLEKILHLIVQDVTLSLEQIVTGITAGPLLQNNAPGIEFSF